MTKPQDQGRGRLRTIVQHIRQGEEGELREKGVKEKGSRKG